MKCPECREEMIFNNSFDLELSNGVEHIFMCNPCRITVLKEELIDD